LFSIAVSPRYLDCNSVIFERQRARDGRDRAMRRSGLDRDAGTVMPIRPTSMINARYRREG
jgi:hypothetical protein